MLAEEYILIAPFADQLRFQFPNKTQLYILTSTSVILLGFRPGCRITGTSTAARTLAVTPTCDIPTKHKLYNNDNRQQY
jgi:hypothetical protein